MELQAKLWDRVLHPRGRVGRVARRAGLTAVGTYTAYVVHGVLNPKLLRPDVTPEERREPLPGDELVSEPDWVTDFGTTVAAPPEAVWPWLVQIGYGRAGWYTWYPLDNGGRGSADAVVPELQTLKVGDVVPDGPRAADGFGVWRVHAIEPNRALVLHSRRNLVTGMELPPDARETFVDSSWVFALRELSPGRTRVHVRVRARFHGRRGLLRPLSTVARLLFGFGDNVMENTLLAGLRERAERGQAS